jgi:hypothetical protein
MRRIVYQNLIAATFFILTGCTTYQPLTAERLKGSLVRVQSKKLAQNQQDACSTINTLRVSETDYPAAATEAGILPDDFLSLQKTITQLQIIVSIRDANQSCAPHLQAGMASKGHQVLTKTFSENNLSSEYKYLAGTVSTLAQRPKPGEKIKDPLTKQYLTADGKPLTCDYDLMDVAQANGQRVQGESTEDLEIRQKLNENLPWRGQPPHPVVRIMHGAQAEYSNYLRFVAAKGDVEPPILSLNKPEAPLTAMTNTGTVYRLQAIEDALNFYLCHHIEIPAEWNLQY